jgi:hypothetical protein
MRKSKAPFGMSAAGMATAGEPQAGLPQQAVSGAAGAWEWACGAIGFRAFWFVMNPIGNPEAGVESNDHSSTHSFAAS